MSDPHAIRRRRLLFRAEHRGFKEADLVIGGFAREQLPGMSEEDCSAGARGELPVGGGMLRQEP